MNREHGRAGSSRAIKGALALGLAGAALSAPSAYAQSYLMQQLQSLPEYNASLGANNVTIYGTLDESMAYTKAQQAVGKVQMQSGGEYTSKIGVFGREDLGGGLKAEFNLEAGFQADTGAVQDTTSLFNRASWVGLKSPEWGAIRVGNQLAAMLPLFVDPFGVVSTNSVFSWAGSAVVQKKGGTYGYNSDLGTGATTLQTRVARSITWTTPRMGGFGAQFMYAFAASTSTSASNTADQGGVMYYTTGPFYFAASYNQVWSTDTTPVRNDIPALAVIYDTGNLVLSTSYSMYAPHYAGDGIARVYTLGAILPVGVRHTWRASAVYRDVSGVHDSSGADAHDAALGFELGYDYAFSKRTSLYARAGMVRNYGISTVMYNSTALPTNGSAYSPDYGIATASVSLGIVHHF